MTQLQRLFWLTGMFSVVLASAAQADSLEASAVSASEVVPVEELNRSEEPKPATTVEEWIGQIEAQEQSDAATELAQTVTQITGVQVSETENGLELTLEATGPLAEPQTSVVGNALTAEIPNAVLALPEGDEFQATDPAEGIARVSVTAVGQDRIQVAITGTNAPPEATVSAEAGSLVWTVVPGIAQVGDTDDAIEIVVTGEQDGYSVPNASTATRTDTPLRDIPRSIQVIPRQVLEDQQVVQLREALRNVSGVNQDSGFAGTVDRFIIRGFRLNNRNFLRNGLRDGLAGVIRDTSNIERIEVLKGPASVLFGTIEPGGAINVITKQPLSFPQYSLDLQAGNFGFVRPSIDLTGPLDADGSLLYRLNAAYQHSEPGGFRNDAFDQNVERFFVSPVISWAINDRTDITFEFEYLDDERPFDRGLVAFGDEIIDLPRDTNFNEFASFTTTERLIASYRLEHRFSDNWKLRNQFQFLSRDTANARAESFGIDETAGIMNRRWVDQIAEQSIYFLQADVVGNFNTGSIEHSLVLGFDLERQDGFFDGRFQNSAPELAVDLQNPQFGLVPRPRQEDLPQRFVEDLQIDNLGIYIQDQITFLDNLKLLIGGRYDVLSQDTGSLFGPTQDFGALNETRLDESAFSPQIGIVYQPIEPLSLYASYSRSFAPNFGTDVSGSPFDPERGNQYEVGIRGELLEGRLIANLVGFNLTKTNIRTADPANPGFNIAIGEQRSRGVELDVAGEILPGWNIIASYTYLDAEITRDNFGVEGRKPNGIANNAASLWTTYEIQQGDLEGLGFGLGLFYVGDRSNSPFEDRFDIDSYLRTDARLSYRRNNWEAAINFRNLFDINYIEASAFREEVIPGIPFTVIGSFSVTF